MPKSKRNKQVELSKTKKHGLEGKKALYNEIHTCLDTYTNLFIFSVNDMRNSKMKNVREQWKHSRFFIGKNKVMAMALGRTPEEEYKPNLHKVGENLKGQKGLLFSNKSTEEALSWFNSYCEGDYARSGNIATEDVSLPEGPLLQFPHNLESYLRQLGLPTTLKKGVIHLLQDYDVCKAGDVLTPDVAKILKLLGYEMAEFQIKIECVWSQDGSFLDLKSDSKENIVEDVSNSALKAGYEISKVEDDEVMEVIESPTNGVKEQLTAVSQIQKESIVNVNDKEEEKGKQEEKKPNEDEKESSEQDDSEDEEIPDLILESSEKDTVPNVEETDQVNEHTETTEETPDDSALLNLTKQKINDVEVTPPKYSPKMTRARARASAVKKVKTPEERAANAKSSKKATRKSRNVNKV